MNNTEPLILNIRESDRKHYDRLSQDGPFSGQGNKVLFMTAMIIGFLKGNRVKLDKKKDYIRTEYFREEEKLVIKAIAVCESGDLKVLADRKEVYSIAEEFAAGGIGILIEDVCGPQYGTFVKRFESQLVNEFAKMDQTLAE